MTGLHESPLAVLLADAIVDNFFRAQPITEQDYQRACKLLTLWQMYQYTHDQHTRAEQALAKYVPMDAK